MINDSQLTDMARGVARCLTFNDSKVEDDAKRILLEMAHRIDSMNIRVHKKKDGFLVINALGKSRFMTFKESFLYRVFDVVPGEV